MNLKKVVSAAAFTALAIFGVGAGHATIIGTAYFVLEAESQNAVIGFAHGAPNATFSTPNGTIDFDSNACASCYTLGGFLGSTPGEITLTGSAADLAMNLDTALGGTIIELMGMVTVSPDRPSR